MMAVNRSGKVLVVDDRLPMLKLFLRMLRERYEVLTAENAAEALALVEREEPDVAVTDVRMPDGDGISLFRKIRSTRPETEVVLMTAFGDVGQAVDAMREGAFYYVTKPFEPDQMLAILEKALERRRLLSRNAYLEAEVASRVETTIVGKSEAMRRVLELVDRVAGTDSTVLIRGESGTGKELVARALHVRSSRVNARFVAVNCGAFPKDLIEAELFGHARGAFSGAATSKKGLVEEAHGGTLFLDEVSELETSLQVKLTRAIQEKEIRRVGETGERRVDVRFVAATNRDLERDVREGRFREDLFFRLNVFPIRVPPLRERMQDVPDLVDHFIAHYNARFGRKIEGVDPAALAHLASYSWPGNVRELQNVIERAMILEHEARITLGSLVTEANSTRATDAQLDSSLEGLPYREYMEVATARVQRTYVERALARNQGNVTRTAEVLGLERETLHRILKKLGLRADEFRA